MQYEVSHVYLDGTIGNEQLKGIEIYNHLRGDGATSSIMIDDYSLKHGGENILTVLDIVNFYKNHTKIDLIKLESEFTPIAEMLINVLDIKKEKFRKENKIVYFFNNGKNKIKLKEVMDDGVSRYSCASLSASYHLYRSGMIENNIFCKQRIEICSILPRKYVHVESQVKSILKELGCENRYVFY